MSASCPFFVIATRLAEKCTPGGTTRHGLIIFGAMSGSREIPRTTRAVLVFSIITLNDMVSPSWYERRSVSASVTLNGLGRGSSTEPPPQPQPFPDRDVSPGRSGGGGAAT